MITQQLLDYIEKQIKQGIDREDIKKILVENGWDNSDAEEAFRIVYSSAVSMSKYVSKKRPAYVNKMPQNKEVKDYKPEEKKITEQWGTDNISKEAKSTSSQKTKSSGKKIFLTIIIFVISVSIASVAVYLYFKFF